MTFFRCTHCGRALGTEGDSCGCGHAIDKTWSDMNRRWNDALMRGQWRDEEYVPDPKALELLEAA